MSVPNQQRFRLQHLPLKGMRYDVTVRVCIYHVLAHALCMGHMCNSVGENCGYRRHNNLHMRKYKGGVNFEEDEILHGSQRKDNASLSNAMLQ